MSKMISVEYDLKPAVTAITYTLNTGAKFREVRESEHSLGMRTSFFYLTSDDMIIDAVYLVDPADKKYEITRADFLHKHRIEEGVCIS